MAVFKNVIIKKYGYPVENVESLVVVDVNLPKVYHLQMKDLKTIMDILIVYQI